MKDAYLCGMNFLQIVLLILSISLLNVLVFFIFKKYLLKKENPAMKFLGVNVGKDLVWIIFWLFIIEKNTTNFLILIAVFLAATFAIYYMVIRVINNS